MLMQKKEIPDPNEEEIRRQLDVASEIWNSVALLNVPYGYASRYRRSPAAD